jgi:STAM-binding protein
MLGDSHSASYSLRTVFIAHDLVQKFAKTVVQNTLQNIETCGILAGSLSNDRFRMTHVLIPKQKGTSDSCDSLDDLTVFTEQERLSLICLGWIHVCYAFIS